MKVETSQLIPQNKKKSEEYCEQLDTNTLDYLPPCFNKPTDLHQKKKNRKKKWKHVIYQD